MSGEGDFIPFLSTQFSGNGLSAVGFGTDFDGISFADDHGYLASALLVMQDDHLPESKHLLQTSSCKQHNHPCVSLHSSHQNGVASLSSELFSLRSLEGLPLFKAGTMTKGSVFSSFELLGDHNYLVGTINSSSSESSSSSSSLMTTANSKTLLQPGLSSSYNSAKFEETENALSSLTSGSLILFDMTRGYSSEFSKLNHGITTMSVTTRGQFICGGSDGTITLIDARSPRNLKNSIKAHTSRVVDVSSSGNLLISCGRHLLSQVQKSKAEPFVRVFDLRTNRQLPPIQCKEPPVCARFFPSLGSFAVILGRKGSIKVCDVNMDDISSKYYQVLMSDDTTFMTDLDISPSNTMLGMTDTSGIVHLWTSTIHDPQIHDLPMRSTLSVPMLPPPMEIPVTQFSHASFWDDTNSVK